MNFDKWRINKLKSLKGKNKNQDVGKKPTKIENILEKKLKKRKLEN